MYRRLFLLFVMLLAFAATQSLAQESKEKLYRIYVTDPSEIRLLAEQGYDIYYINPGNYIEVLVHPDKINRVKEKNFTVDFIANSFKELVELELGDALSEYHDYEATYQELTSISQDTQYPPISKLDTIGYSVENRVIGVLKVSDYPELDEDEPSILIVGCHHGNEFLSIEAPLVFIHYLVDNYGSDPEITNWVDTMEIWFIPLVNPDGRERITRYNVNNVDLNRNYSFQFTAGSSHGPYAFSEPETRTIRDFVAIHPPILSLTYHTSGQLVLYSWTHTNAIAPDQPILMQIGGIVADSLNYTLRQGGHWYFTAGEFCDFMYGVHGTMAFTIEMYTSQTPPAGVIDQVMARNLPGFISILKQVNRSGLTGLTTDATTESPIEATIDILEVNDQGLLFPRKSEPFYGRYYRYLAPGNYNVTISAPGYQTAAFYNVPVTLDSLLILNAQLDPAANIVVKNFYIDDDSLGSTNGNGDASPDKNETIGLSIILENKYQVTAKDVYAILNIQSSYVNILNDSLFYGDLKYNTPTAAVDTFLFYIHPSYPDSEILDFRLTIRDSSGMEWHHHLSFGLISKITFKNISENLPNEFKLFNNYPNPFNPTTTIAYFIHSPRHVTLKIIDVLGRVVNALVFEDQEAGYYQIIWKGEDTNGNIVPSGVYFYQLEAGNFVETKKLLFLN